MTMTVKELIRELKHLPQDMVVGYSHHDNRMGEVAGWVDSVSVEKEVYVATGRETGRTIVILH